MGRELRRKQAKKEGKSLVNEDKEMKEAINFKNLFIITSVFVVVLLILYLVTALFFTKELDWFSKNESDVSTTQDTSGSVGNTILAKESLSQKEDEYYVYFYDYTKEVSSVSSAVNNLDEKVYKVNIKDGFNANYVGEDSNKEASSIDELKVKDLTLIKVVNGKIEEYYEGKEEIRNGLDN